MGRQIKSVGPQSQFLSLSFSQSLFLSPLSLSDYQRFAIWCRVIAAGSRMKIASVTSARNFNPVEMSLAVSLLMVE